MKEKCKAYKNKQNSKTYCRCASVHKFVEFSADKITMCTSIQCSLRSSCVRFSYKEEDYVDMPQEDFFKKLNKSKLCSTYLSRVLYED